MAAVILPPDSVLCVPYLDFDDHDDASQSDDDIGVLSAQRTFGSHIRHERRSLTGKAARSGTLRAREQPPEHRVTKAVLRFGP